MFGTAVLNKFAFGFETIHMQIVISKYIVGQQRTRKENLKYSRTDDLTKEIKYETQHYLESDLNFERTLN